jgi:nicotinamide mononucleotide transporter
VWFDLLYQQLKHIDSIQAAVLLLGITEVLLAKANNIWLYPAGIAATMLAIFSLFTAGLYAECLLHLYYIVMSVYGWWFWITKPDSKPVEVTFATRKEWFTTIAIASIAWVVLFLMLTYITHSKVAEWDAWVSASGWAGMWLLARRKIENWILLNISNAFAVPLLFYKELPLFALLTAFLFVVACIGYIDWLKIIRRKEIRTTQFTTR